MNRRPHTFRRHALATAVVLALAGAAQAQLSTSTIKGQISAGRAAAQAGLAVTAVARPTATPTAPPRLLTAAMC